jgi:hypothetical protein
MRPFGPKANSGLRSELYDDVQLGIVRLNRPQWFGCSRDGSGMGTQ